MQRVSLGKDFIFDILRAALYSVLFTVGGVLIFALVIKATDVSDTVITIFNIANKAVALLLAIFLGVREKSQGLLKGIFIGGVYLAFTLVMFTILNKGYDSGFLSVFDIIFVFVVGTIISMVRVNL